MPNLDTTKFTQGADLQPGVVDCYLKITGAAATTYATAAAGADNDNRIVTSITRSAAGVYDLVLNMAGRVLLGGEASFAPATGTTVYIMNSLNLSSSTLTFKLMDAATPTAIDLINGDVMRLTLHWKNSGA